MTDELNCTQFTEPYPEPSTDEAGNSTIPWLITTVVRFYRPYHYYLLTSLVVFAFFANILIVIVLSHKEMRKSGVNVTMLLIALCDFGCSISGLSQLFLRSYSDNYSSYATAYGQIIVDYLAVGFHASSLYLAVGMAFCRVMSLSNSSKNRDQWQSPKYALRVACALCFPVFAAATFVIFINAVKESEEDGIYLDISDISLANECLFMKVSLVASGTCFKIAPCVLMLLSSLFLLRKIDEGKKSANNTSHNNRDKGEKIDRSSRFIQFVLVVFLVTETPQGVFSIIGGLAIIDYINYLQNLSIFMNILAFFNTTTSFIIYSALSAKFRKLFTQMFLPQSVTEKLYRYKVMANELGCTQFTEPWPDPGSVGAEDLTLPWLFTTIVSTYRPYHYYLLTSLVAFSFFANICIVIVLSQKEMRSSGINVTMLFIAVCDFGCSISGIIQLFLRLYSRDEHNSYWIIYTQITVDYLVVACHASSIYLAVSMAFCRVMSLKFSNKNRSVEDGIFMAVSDISLANECFYLRFVLVASGLGFKIFPSILMIFLTISLLKLIGKEKTRTIHNRSGKEDKLDRSSRFIQVVLIVFLITECPHGIFSITGGLFVIDYMNYFQKLSIVMASLGFVNTTTSFIIYSALSTKFRKLFLQIFLPRFLTDSIIFKRSNVVVQIVANSSPAS